jgi:hypothetical protein
MRVARSRELVAQGRPAAVVARVAGISRQAIYRRPKRPPTGQRRSHDRVDRVVLAVARANPTNGTRMVAALAGRELGGQVNRKRVQRLMREHRVLQRRRSEGRRRRPGFFRVERPDQLWHLDMTSIWVAEHGWCYLNAAITAARARSPAGRSMSAAAPRSDRRHPGRRRPARHRAGTAHARDRQRLSLHQPRVPRPPGRTGDHPPPRRLPRPREPGLHRVLVLQAQAALHLARRVRDPRRSPPRDRRLRRPLPPPTSQPAGLPHPARGRRHLEGSRRPANPSGLT